MKREKTKLHKKLTIAVALSCMSLSPAAFADPVTTIINNGDYSTSATGMESIATDTTIDADTYFTGVQSGKIITMVQVDSGDNWQTLYQEIYGNKYDALQDASSNYNSAAGSYVASLGGVTDDAWIAFTTAYADYQSGTITEAELESAYSAWESSASGDEADGVKAVWADTLSSYNNFKSADANYEAVFTGSNQLDLSQTDVENLHQNTGSASYQETTTYVDTVTQSEQLITVRTNFNVSSNSVSLPNTEIVQYYAEQNGEQYSDVDLITIDNSTVTVENSATNPDVADLVVIMKSGSNVFKAENGSTINFDDNFTYSMGDDSHVGKVIESTTSGSISLGTVVWAEALTTPFGDFNIVDQASLIAYNDALITYVTTQMGLKTRDEVQSFYDTWIEKAYTVNQTGTINYTYNWDQTTLDAITNDMTAPDVGLESPAENHLVELVAGGNVVNVATGVTVDPTTSTGTIIYSANTTGTQNTINIDGTLGRTNGGSAAIYATNTDVNISSTGNVLNSITIIDGDITNDGAIVATNISGNGSTLQNNNKINGTVVASDKAVVKNDTEDSIIKGQVRLSGGASLINNNIVTGGTISADDSTIENQENGILVGNLDTTSSVNEKLAFMGAIDSTVFKNDGTIYVGYIVNDDNEVEATTINTQGGNVKEYYGVYVDETSSFAAQDNSVVNVYASQNLVTGVYIDGGIYTDTSDSVINVSVGRTLNDAAASQNVGLAIVGATTTADVNSTINVYGFGDHGLDVKDGAIVTLNGVINVIVPTDDDFDSDDITAATIGAYVHGEGSSLTLEDTFINLATDRGIGVHVRSGGAVTFEGDSGINFDATSTGQIGVLISGVSAVPTTFTYNADSTLTLKGLSDSVMFRIERGADFTIDGANLTDQTISSEDLGENSALFVVTSGQTEAGVPEEATADIRNITLYVNGENSSALRVEGGATATLDDTTKVYLQGEGNTVAVVDGYYYDILGNHDDTYDGNSEVTSSMILTDLNFDDTAGSVAGSVGYHALHGGKLIHDGEIDFLNNEKGLIGVLLTDGGQLETTSDSLIQVKGVAVQIEGKISSAKIYNKDGSLVYATGDALTTTAAAYNLVDNANLVLSGDADDLTEAEATTIATGTAHGILTNINSDGTDSTSEITLQNTFIDMSTDPDGTGSGIENRGNATSITFSNARIDVEDGAGIHSAVGFGTDGGVTSSGVINVKGSGTGILFESMTTAGEPTTNAIAFTNAQNLVVNVLADTGKGIVANTTQNVTTSGSVNVLSSTGKAALEVMGGATTVTQQGYLHSASTAADGAIVVVNDEVSTFTNSGEILFGDFGAELTNGSYEFTANTADDDPLRTSFSKTSGATITFNNETGGKVNGVVVLTVADGSSGNTVNLKSGSEGEVWLTGTGDDIFNVTNIQGSDIDGLDKQFVQLDGGDGDDVVNFSGGSNYTITKADTVTNIEQMNLRDTAYIKLDKVLPDSTEAFDIASAATLQYNIAETTTFDKQVTNAGTFYVTGEDELRKFDFTAEQTAFTGTFEIDQIDYLLDGINQSSLAGATLMADDDSVILVGDGEQLVGNVTFNGSTIEDASTFIFGDINFQTIPDGTIAVADNYIKTDTLTVGNVKIQAEIKGIDNKYDEAPIDTNLKPVLELDDDNTGVQIIQAKTAVTGSGTAVLVDENGDIVDLTNGISVDIIQNGAHVANAIYGAGLKVESDKSADSYENGLYITSGLAAIELLEKEANNSNALRLDATYAATEAAQTLTAKLTNGQDEDGNLITGDVVISGTEKEVILNNGLNDYRGKTIVEAGATLKTAQSGSFGDTAELVLQGTGSTVNLNGKTETVGVLTVNAGAAVDFDGGTLTIDEAQNWDGVASSEITGTDALTGAGQLNVHHDAIVNVYNSNENLSAAIAIGNASAASDASYVTIYEGDSLGTGAITLSKEAVLELNLATDTSISNTFEEGDETALVKKTADGTVTFAADSAGYLATTDLEEGGIIFDGGTVKSVQVNVAEATTMTATEGTVFAGNIDNVGTTIALADVVVQQNFNNSGSFYVGNYPTDITSTAAKVTIQGNYIGTADSNLYFRGDLEGDDSVINNLIIDGDSSGEGWVYVANSNGTGAYTENGIKLIEINGDSAAEFTQAERIIVGAFTYSLQRGDTAGANLSDYYLVSRLSQEPITYYTNYLLVNDMTDLRLQDRIGSKEFGDFLKEQGQDADDSIWARMLYRKSSFNDEYKMNKIHTNSSYMQIGYDIANWNGENDQNRNLFGVIFGFMNGSHSVKGFEDSTTYGNNDIYSVGLYSTWLGNKKDDGQTYVDTWVQYLWGKNKMKGEYINEKYDIDGWAASIEAGHTKKIDEKDGRQYFIEPKVQLIWNNIGQDSVDWALNGGVINRFEEKNNHQLTSRLGLRFVSRKADPVKKFKRDNSFLELNWLHNFEKYEFSLGGNDLQMGQDNVFEVKAGYEQQFNEKYSLWLNGFIQLGSNEYRSFGTQFGVKYSF